MKTDITKPCAQCPFRRDAPRGVWALAHYADLVRHNSDHRIFNCHATRDRGLTDRAACAGWVIDQRRLKDPSPGFLYATRVLGLDPTKYTSAHELYDSARDAGIANIDAIRRIQQGDMCDGSGRPWADAVGLKGWCEVCGAVLPRPRLDDEQEDVAPCHLPPVNTRGNSTCSG